MYKRYDEYRVEFLEFLAEEGITGKTVHGLSISDFISPADIEDLFMFWEDLDFLCQSYHCEEVDMYLMAIWMVI